METALQQPALTRLNKAIHQETLPIFYGSNTFRICMVEANAKDRALCWLRSIGPSNCKRLLELRASCWGESWVNNAGFLKPTDVEKQLSFGGVIAKAEGFVLKDVTIGYTRVVFQGDAEGSD